MSLLAVAWDVDGTLIDSEPLHHEALVAVCAAFGADLSTVSGETFRGIHMGDVWTMLAPRLSPEADEASWLAAIIDYYVAHRDRLRPIPARSRRCGRSPPAASPRSASRTRTGASSMPTSTPSASRRS